LYVQLDDTFIITGAYLRLDPAIAPEERIRLTMEEVGTSISITTITTIIAFMLGLASSVPSIYWLCLYAFPTVFIDFIYQITFFVAILMLDERRIKAKRKDICLWCVDDSAKEDDNDVDDVVVSEKVDEEQNILVTMSSKSLQKKQHGVPEQEPTKHIADRAMAWYARQLMRPSIKAAVIVVFTYCFAFCIYRTTMLKQAFEATDLFPVGSYVTAAIDAMKEYQERTVMIEIMFRGVNQSDPVIQQQMIEYIDDLVELPPFGAQPPYCWVRDFQSMKDSPAMKESPYYDTVSQMSFEEQVEFALSIPAINEGYGRDIVLDEKGQITASRCIILARNSFLENVQDEIGILHDQRAVTNDQPVNKGRQPKDEAFFTILDMYLIWEFYSIAVSELIGTTISTVLAVSVVTLIFIPHWTAVFFMVPMISIIYIDMMGKIDLLHLSILNSVHHETLTYLSSIHLFFPSAGFMQLAGLYINAVSYVCLVISIGLIVDFLMHIILRYCESTKRSRDARVIDTLETMGASILLGGLSTFLGILPLCLSTSTILRTVFTSLCTMVVLSITHGLIFLPVVLSVLGPEPKALPKEPRASKMDLTTTGYSDGSSVASTPRNFSQAESVASLNTVPPHEAGKETVEQFIHRCATKMAHDAFRDDEVSAQRETSGLLEFYTNIYKTTSDPSAFLLQLMHETRCTTVVNSC